MTRLRFSQLKHMAESPAHYKYWAGREIEPTSALRIGTAVHAGLLGGGTVVRYDGTRRGAAWDAFAAQYSGATILTASEYDTAQGCVDAVLEHNEALYIMRDGWADEGSRNEHLIEWTFNGTPFRSTPDRYYGPAGETTLVELKTTRSAEPNAFTRDALRRHYHAQLGVYAAALASIGRTVTRHVIVAVETKPPYAVSVFEVSPRTVDAGYRLACGWLERYRVCLAAGEWPGYSQTVVPIDLEPEMDLDFTGVEDTDNE